MEQTNNKAIDLKDFTYLMLITLARKTQIIDFINPDKKYACLPVNYKQIIENILCEDNGWREKFSVLINTEEYFNNHFEWETRLSEKIVETLKDLNKSYEYDFELDRIIITFTTQEIDSIMEQYEDENIKHHMDHFVNLLTDYIYTREYQEKFYDESHQAVLVMRKIQKTKGVYK